MAETVRLLFLRSTGLGDVVAEEGTVHELPEHQARELIAAGQAMPAPGEPDLSPPPPMTTDSLGLNPKPAKTGRTK